MSKLVISLSRGKQVREKGEIRPSTLDIRNHLIISKAGAVFAPHSEKEET